VSPEVLVTDIGLPDMSGTALAEQALARVPALSVIYVSGAAINPDVPGFRAAGVLLKPFTFDALFATIAAVVTESAKSEASAVT
jgi:DNA-binding response OmpR family regulator